MRGPASRRNRASDAYDFPEGFVDQPIPESSRNHSIPIRYISVTPFQIDSLLLSPNLQYPNYPEKEELEPLEEPLSAQLPFWKPEEIGTPDWDTSSGLAALRLRHTLKSITCQFPHLTRSE